MTGDAIPSTARTPRARAGAVLLAMGTALLVAALGAWAGGAREAGRSAAATGAAFLTLCAALALPGGLPRVSKAEWAFGVVGCLAALQLLAWPEGLARLLAPAAAAAREASLGRAGASPSSHDLGATARAALLFLSLPLLACALRGLGPAGGAWALARCLALALAAHAAVALHHGDYAEDDLLLGGESVGNVLNAWGTFVNRAHFAGYAVVCLGPALALFRGPRPFLDRPLALGSVALGSVAVFASGSRGGMLGVALALAAALVCAVPERLRKGAVVGLVLLGVALAGAAVGATAYGMRFPGSDRIARALAPKPGEGKRLEVWKGSLDLAMEQPVLGSGVDAFRWSYGGAGRPVSDRWVSTAESDVLQAAAEGGVALLAALAAAAVLSLRALGRMRRASTPAGRASSTLALCGLVGSIPIALTSAPFHVPAVVLAGVAAWGVVRGLLWADARAENARDPAILARTDGGES